MVIPTFEEFLATQSPHIPLGDFAVNIVLAAVLSFILGQVYIYYGSTLSNRRMFARNFMMLAMTTMLIITVVKSSLALSLGLVGALSIIRFRAAIKEPEELAYIFLVISIGLGLGADQRLITIVAGNRKRQRYLSYLVFDQQKIRYYGVFDATYPLSDAELRFQVLILIK
jgi:hypothetical protein